MKCQNCAAENPDNNQFCGGCGQKILKTIDCTACAHKNPLEFKFCGNCGVKLIIPGPPYKIIPLEKKCHQCGHKNPSAFKFCEECGSKQDAIAPPSSPPEKLSVVEQKPVPLQAPSTITRSAASPPKIVRQRQVITVIPKKKVRPKRRIIPLLFNAALRFLFSSIMGFVLSKALAFATTLFLGY